MARVKVHDDGRAQLWLSRADTQAWARRPGNEWPCSTIAGHSLYAEYEPNGDLVDRRIDGRRGTWVDGHEFDSITSDHLPEGYPGRR